MANQVVGTLEIPDFTENTTPACSKVDPELFFPQEVEFSDGTVRSSYTNIAEAKNVCSSCSLTVDCLAYALKNNELGVWGGTTEEQRKALRRRVGIPTPRKLKTPNRL